MRYIQLTLLLLLISCSSKNKESAPDSFGTAKVDQLENDRKDKNEKEDHGNFNIKTATYKFQVENVDTTTKRIEKLAPQHNAFIGDMYLVTTGSEISNSLVIRVPFQNFEKLIEALGSDALFTDFKRISTEDVSEEFVDIESRLKTKREVRDRYIDILKNKAKTVEDVLKAEEQIRILQEEIEAKEGRLKFLQNRVSMSTINLEIYQRVEYKEIPETYEMPYLSKAKEGLLNGWNIITSLTLVLINIWPIVFVALLLYWKRNWLREKLTTKK